MLLVVAPLLRETPGRCQTICQGELSTMGPLGLLAAPAIVSTAVYVPAVIGLVVGIGGTIVVRELLGRQRRSAIRRESDRIMAEANKEAERIVQKAEVDAKAEFIKRN